VTARLSRPLIAILVCTPFLLVLAYVGRYSVQVPCRDEFLFIIPILGKVYDRTLAWQDFLKGFYYEHPIFFSRAVFLFIALVTHYSTRAVLYVNCFLLGMVALIWFLDYRRTLLARGQQLDLARALAFVPVVWLVFSLRQSLIFLLAITICETLALSGIVLAVYLLGTSRGRGGRFLVAAAVAILTSGTTASGLLIWPMGLAYLWWIDRSDPGERRVRMWRVGIWSALGVSVWGAFFSVAEMPIANRVGADSLRMIPFSLIVAGAPFTRHPVWAGILGGLFILAASLMVAIMARRSTAPRHPTIAFPLILFSVVNVVLIAYGRHSFSFPVALQDHFTAFTCQGLIGLYLMLTISRAKSARIARIGLLVVCLLALARATVSAFEAGPAERTRAMRLAYYLRTYRSQPDLLLGQLATGQRRSNPEWVRSGAPILERLGLNLFSEPSPLPPQGPSLPDRAQFAVERAELSESACELEGWAVDAKLQARAKGVFLQLDEGKLQVPAQYGLSRSEVANPSLRDTGFYVSFDPRLVGAGRHRAALQIVAADGFYVSDTFDLVVPDRR
jgi:hypothetical protein